MILSKCAGCSKNPIPKLLCASCCIGKANARSIRKYAPHTQIKTLRFNKLLPGNIIFADQYISKIKGRLPHTRGKESDSDKYVSGTIFVDAATSFTRVYHQPTLLANDTLTSKNEFEYELHSYGIRVKTYHGDNGIFKSSAWVDEYKFKHQTHDFSGVGTQHYNGVTERAQGTISCWYRCVLLNRALHDPDKLILVYGLSLWITQPLWNKLPSILSSYSLEELFLRTKSSIVNINRARILGSPLYILDPKL